MKLIKVTLNVAFLDSLNVSADAVRRTIFNQVNDGLEAEVCFTSDVEERAVDFPDFDIDGEDGNAAIEAWHEKARTLMGPDKP